MGEKSYRIDGRLVRFSPNDDELFCCLCTFPGNNISLDGGTIGIGDVADLALFGAAARLIFDGEYKTEEYVYLPHDLPAWIVDGIRDVLSGGERKIEELQNENAELRRLVALLTTEPLHITRADIDAAKRILKKAEEE